MLLRCFGSALSRIVIACLAILPGATQADDSNALTEQEQRWIEEFESARVEGIAKAKQSTVMVFVPGGGGGGSGVLISPEGYALTNFHVSSPAGTYMRCGLADGKVYDAVVVGIDPVGDLALIQLLGRNDFSTAKFVPSRRVQVGDWCFAIGNPFLLATNLQPTVTAGIISGVRRYQYPSGTLLEYGNCFQTDASINPGNSGGPLYDNQGDLIGVIGRASFEKRGRVNVGVGYAISGDQAQNFLGCLFSGRIVDHATLGATVGTDEDGSVRVTNILSSSDAYRRGLRYGDEIIEIDGQVIQTANDVQNLLATFPASWRIPITYRQEGQSIETLVRLASVHRGSELLQKMKSALPPPPPAPPKPIGPDSERGDTPNPQNKQTPDSDREEPSDTKEDARKEVMRDAAGDPIPDETAKRIEIREGYANYFYNRLKQDGFINRLRNKFPGQDAGQSSWKLSGQTIPVTADQTASKFELLLSNDGYELIIGDESERLTRGDELLRVVDEQRDAGILACLHALQRMLNLGPDKFGETYYWGTMPLAGERPLRDVTVAVHADLEHRFLQHPETGRLEVIEAVAGTDTDPAELWFESKEDQLPHRLQLRYGLTTVLSLEITDWQMQSNENSADNSDEGA
ncbi:S1C family serine protease [Rhodopirellula halodulae]|uniref:S1C family serine protease n=1 Tax=Rhodopirellula halodulae TaxID=2894198 RepID=UPI001E37DFFD|nr:trypsin-like peptidase domain-containing protein [Rhodopirellula sp. JC737]MCC9657527.1 trypsin-like peptidase domain-containing protein [Rhodopirellula sp. JC737]